MKEDKKNKKETEENTQEETTLFDRGAVEIDLSGLNYRVNIRSDRGETAVELIELAADVYVFLLKNKEDGIDPGVR
jgi:hypothetical protein